MHFVRVRKIDLLENSVYTKVSSLRVSNMHFVHVGKINLLGNIFLCECFQDALFACWKFLVFVHFSKYNTCFTFLIKYQYFSHAFCASQKLSLLLEKEWELQNLIGGELSIFIDKHRKYICSNINKQTNKIAEEKHYGISCSLIKGCQTSFFGIALFLRLLGSSVLCAPKVNHWMVDSYKLNCRNENNMSLVDSAANDQHNLFSTSEFIGTFVGVSDTGNEETRFQSIHSSTTELQNGVKKELFIEEQNVFARVLRRQHMERLFVIFDCPLQTYQCDKTRAPVLDFKSLLEYLSSSIVNSNETLESFLCKKIGLGNEFTIDNNVRFEKNLRFYITFLQMLHGAAIGIIEGNHRSFLVFGLY